MNFSRILVGSNTLSINLIRDRFHGGGGQSHCVFSRFFASKFPTMKKPLARGQFP